MVLALAPNDGGGCSAENGGPAAAAMNDDGGGAKAPTPVTTLSLADSDPNSLQFVYCLLSGSSKVNPRPDI